MDGVDIKLNSQEQILLGKIFGLITKLGYKESDRVVEVSDQGLRFNVVKVMEAGIYRLAVYDLKTERLGAAVTYNLTFDPVNKKGIVFDKYLETVTIHLIGVNRTNDELEDYRECVIEIVMKDPQTHLKTQPIYSLKTSSLATTLGVAWLDKQTQLTTNQASIIVEILEQGLV